MIDLRLGAALVAAGTLAAPSKAAERMEKAPYGKTADGEVVELFTLRNAKGMVVRIATYGAVVVSLEVPDRQGRIADVVLGFDGLDGYLGPNPHFGGVVGRYG